MWLYSSHSVFERILANVCESSYCSWNHSLKKPYKSNKPARGKPWMSVALCYFPSSEDLMQQEYSKDFKEQFPGVFPMWARLILEELRVWTPQSILTSLLEQKGVFPIRMKVDYQRENVYLFSCLRAFTYAVRFSGVMVSVLVKWLTEWYKSAV